MRTVIEGIILMAKLIISKNQNVLMTLELDPAKEYIAGRSPDCTILLDDVIFSRQHFKIFYSQDKWTVQSISKYSQLSINHRESDYFVLKNDDKFSTFTYEFHFTDSLNLATDTIKPSTVENTNGIEQEIAHADDKTDQLALDDKTFVPQMTSQEWSIGVPYLLLRREDGSTQTMRLEGEYWVMGRDEGCDITVEDPKASREHCEIFYKQKKYFVIDKNSSNGTLVNYKKIPPEQAVPLRSGDEIQIGKLLYIFEIRDPMFHEKLVNLPAEVDYSPSVDFGINMKSGGQKVIRVTKNEQKKKLIMICGTAVLLVFMYILSEEEAPQNKNLSSEASGAATKQTDSLSPEQKDFVDKSYNLAKTLYVQGKYELAMTEILKIHALVPEYKDSKEIALYSKNAIDTLMEQKDIERNEQEQKKLASKVEGIVEQCGINYKGHKNTEQLQDCLAPALELDPENTKAAQLVDAANLEDMKKEQLQEQKSYYKGQVAQRKKIFAQAESLKRQGKTLDAISAYSRHIASNLPDPERLEDKSRVEVKNLQQKITDEVSKLKSAAEASYNKKDYRDAIGKLEQALRLNPQDSGTKEKFSTYSRELQSIVKNIYGDSVLEENLGNIDKAKEIWKKIRSMDVTSGEYYKKSGAKLKKYGS